jgi:hypothetical protein
LSNKDKHDIIRFNMAGIEDRSGGKEGQPRESRSQLALIREKLQGLAADRKIHIIGERKRSYISQTGSILSMDGRVEDVQIYVTPTDPPQTHDGMANYLSSLNSTLGMDGNVLAFRRRRSSFGFITYVEEVASMTTDVSITLKAADTDPDLLAVEDHKTAPLTRSITLDVQADEAMAELDYKFGSEEISYREYSRARLRQRHPHATKVFDALARRSPQQSPK